MLLTPNILYCDSSELEDSAKQFNYIYMESFTCVQVSDIDFVSAGYYLIVQNGPPYKAGQQTTIVSPKLPSNLGTACLSFWYHMWNADNSTLNMFTFEVSFVHKIFL